MTSKLLLEIGTEEIPAGYIPPAMKQMKNLANKLLKENRITFGKISTFATPRRLTLFLEDVATSQPDIVEKVQGPPKKAAFDGNGNPTKAAMGFAKGKGISVDDLFVETNERGEYIFANIAIQGKDTIEILPEILNTIISSISFPKTMHWDDSGVRFARPVQWILALLDDKVVDFTWGNIKSDNVTFGHRFMSPDAKKVDSPDDYFPILEKSYVILDAQQRKEQICKLLEEEAKKINGRLLKDEELLDSVVYLIEYPAIICGKFSEEFLKLPDQVLVRAMAEHQKYFSVVDRTGKLLPYFLNVIGNAPQSVEQILVSNERVLLARLDDAKFFYEEDTKTSLFDKVETLKQVVFQQDLGTMYDKALRIKDVAYSICQQLCLGQRENVAAQRAAILCKADLVTNMINEKEFAKLQGYMGMKYAKASDEKEDVAEAIYEHYLPRYADDKLPQTHVGAVVSIADKIDTIVGCFGIGLIPSGSQDPYALRRQAIGIIKILLEHDFELSLESLVDRSIALLYNKMKESEHKVKENVMNFFRDRISNIFIEKGFKYDTVDAVLSSSFDSLPDISKRIGAVSIFRKEDQFEALAMGFKRVVNILSKGDVISEPNVGLMEEDAERNLYRQLEETEKIVLELHPKGDYFTMMRHLVALREAIDSFFDNVLVMAEDEGLKHNRLSILHKIKSIFFKIADFSKIVVEG